MADSIYLQNYASLNQLKTQTLRMSIRTSFFLKGELHPDLHSFLEKEVPKGKKKVQVILGVGDAKIGAAISETLGISCQHTGVVMELMRGLFLSFLFYLINVIIWAAR